MWDGANLAYDALGRRERYVRTGVETDYVYDGLNVVQEQRVTRPVIGAPTRTVLADLLTGLGIDETYTRTDGAGAQNLLTDALGSTLALTDAAGTQTTRRRSKPGVVFNGLTILTVAFLTCTLMFPFACTSAEADAKSVQLVQLGERLFGDARFSGDGTVSCASCHRREQQFTDGRATAHGVGRTAGTRNAPSLLYLELYTHFLWDGRAETLLEQTDLPLLSPEEHGLASLEVIATAVAADPFYDDAYGAAFGSRARDMARSARIERFKQAIVAFERSLTPGQSPFDLYRRGQDAGAISESAKRGHSLFTGRAGCSACHVVGEAAATFTDNRFHARGVGLQRVAPHLQRLTRLLLALDLDARGRRVNADPEVAALGRFVVTLDPRDIGAFRTPTLRDVAVTGPYMHDGSIATLEAAVVWEVYRQEREVGETLALTPQERGDLVAFLGSLTSQPP